MLAKATSANTVEQFIVDACARSLPVELHYVDPEGVMISGRTRLLDCDDGQVLADQPLYLEEGADRIPSGSQVTVHLSMGGSRFCFESVLEESGQPVFVNGRRLLRSIVLRTPKLITGSQRRAHLRVPLAAYDPINVSVVPPHARIPNACEIDPPRCDGWMADLSIGGTSVLVNSGILACAGRGKPFYLTFKLPGVDDEFVMFAAARYSRIVRGGEAVRIAFAFQPWAGDRTGREQRRIARFIAAHERRMLRVRK